MFGGLIFKAERLQYRCRSNATGGTATSNMFPINLGHGASLSTFFTPNYFSTALGFSMSVSSSHWVITGYNEPDENPTTSATLNFPAIATNTTVSFDYYSEDCDSILDFFDVALYMNHNANWELHIGSIEWRLNGELKGAWGSMTLYSTMTPTPMCIPVMPGALNISAYSSITFGEPGGIALPGHTESEITSIGGAGFRYLQDGVWKSPPVTFPEPYTLGGVYDLDGILVGGTMWDGTIHCRHYRLWDYVFTGTVGIYDTYRYDNKTEGASASGTIIPDLPKTVARLNDDYAAIIYRGGFPRVTEAARLVDLVHRDGYPLTSPPWIFTDEREKLPAHSQFLATVQNSEHIIEAPMLQPTYSACNISKSVFDFTRENELVVPTGSTEWWWIGGPPFPPGFDQPQVTRRNDAGYYTFPNSIDTDSQVQSYLTHQNKLVEYLNTWANPHWSYFLWMPPDSSSESVKWKIEGIGVNPPDYWLDARQQHIEHPSLPTGERLKIRNHIVTEPLGQNGLAGLMHDQTFGQITSFWGISRFHTDKIEPQASITTNINTAPAWSIGDGEGTITVSNDHVTIHPAADASTIHLTLDVGRFTEYPYMAPHTTTEQSVGWSGDSITSVTVEEVGIDKSKVVLTDTPARLEKKLGTAKKYVGTWKQDYGADYISDIGKDIYKPTSASMSSSIMSSPEGVFTFRLLPARGYDKLLFTITIDSPSDILINSPTFYNGWEVEDTALLRESAMESSVLVKDGPQWRYGQWCFYDPMLGFLNPPLVKEAIGMPTVLDWLAFKRLVWQCKGAFEDLYAEVVTLYDEGIEWTQLKHLAADPFNEIPVTHSFMHRTDNNLLGIMVNSYSEVPPLAGWVNASRDDELQPSDGFSQTAYSLCSTKQWLATTGQEGDNVNELIKPPNDSVLTAADLPRGYLGGFHKQIVDGSEAIDWLVRKDGIDWAKVRPWHGYFSILYASLDIRSISYDTSDAMRHYLAYVNEEGRIWVKRADNILPFDWQEEDSGFDASAVCVRVDRRSKSQMLHLLFAHEDTVYWAKSLDEGATWTMPQTIAPGTFPAMLISRSGIKYIYWVDGTAVKGTILSPTDEVIQSVFTAISPVDEDSGIAVDESTTTKGKPRITLAYIQDGDAKTQTSNDGKTFS